MSLPRWAVTSVEAHPDHTLVLTFADGTAGYFDVTPLLSQASYAPLANAGLFMTAHVDCGTVVWTDQLDIAPELLYEGCTPLC